MKSARWIFVVSCIAFSAAIGREHKIEIVATVVDDDGLPVEGARVCLSLPRYGTGREGQFNEQLSDEDGRAQLRGKAEQAYSVFAEKEGYYGFSTGRRELVTPTSRAKFAGRQEIVFKLRQIRSPVAPIIMSASKRLPGFGIPAGFDLEKGDWIPPAGKGDHVSARLWFATPNDGFIVHRFESREGSDFKFPHEAPIAGYTQSLAWDVTQQRVSLLAEDGKAYIFRCRSELDDEGNVRRALYGTIQSDFRLTGTSADAISINFLYRLNPTWSRSLEFDDSKAQAADSGKLRVRP
jgi:hypothetical protein